jgi:DNA helicase-2/ATP-dependent DNA helicase PcrA
MEEERRLCYVGITRAKEHLFLSHAQSRTLFGNHLRNSRSRFINEIPKELLDEIRPAAHNNNKNAASQDSQFARNFTPFAPHVTNASSKQPTTIDFTKGQRVRHRKFGNGFIVNIQPIGSDYRIEIAFDEFGTKNLMAAFAGLTAE